MKKNLLEGIKKGRDEDIHPSLSLIPLKKT
jgi:hypothetical protein